MTRRPRIRLPGIPFHIVQRGNDKNRTFFDADDFRQYLHLLCRMSERYETAVHAYVLMTNHVHLLMTSSGSDGISRTMQQVSSGYTRWINNRRRRSGTLWEARFRSGPVESDAYCLACYRYIELNPVRAGIVSSPADYPWSSYRENTSGRGPAIVTPHACYLEIAASRTERFARYSALVDEALVPDTIEAIRNGTRKGEPIGGRSFRREIAGAAVSTGRVLRSETTD